MDSVALPGALVYQIESPQLVPSLGVVRDEGPEVVAPDSLLRQSRRQPLPPLRAQRFFSKASSRTLDLSIWSGRMRITCSVVRRVVFIDDLPFFNRRESLHQKWASSRSPNQTIARFLCSTLAVRNPVSSYILQLSSNMGSTLWLIPKCLLKLDHIRFGIRSN